VTHLARLELVDFRGYEHAALDLPPGVTALLGANGQGKTNLLEAVGWLATMSSFRGASTDALVRTGAEQAVLHATVAGDDRPDRPDRLDAELVRNGRNRVQRNAKRVTRARDLVEVLRVTVFAPGDLDLVKGGPLERRSYLDQLLVARHPVNDQLVADLERVVRHRNALLKQSGGRLDRDAALTLDVWDEKLAALGERLVAARRWLLDELEPYLSGAYGALAPTPAVVTAVYETSWSGPLAEALAAGRAEDVRRGSTSRGPQRDELVLSIDAMVARTHRSQGEQRSLALALRLAGHVLLTEATGQAPLLLLDDVFSELDDYRAAALVRSLPPGQTLLASAVELPPGAQVDLVVDVVEGRATPRSEGA
jgi:DNA replication and repair protein RecF